MTFSADPYRTLGLVPGATIDEVKRAYRRLAKRYHPDSAGELEVRRFLAVQSAYEQILGGSDGRGPVRPARTPWDADPARGRATRQGYRARSGGRPGWSSAGWSGGSWWSAGRTAGTPGNETPGNGAGPSPGTRRAESAGPASQDGGATGARPRSGHGRKATLNSTSYDEAVHEPFEPSWEGAGWYGASSGTYWTINPREYADPRKHGPEYQARARRSAGGQPSTGPAAGAPADAASAGGVGDPERDVGSDPRGDGGASAWAVNGPPATDPGPAASSTATQGSDAALSVGILAGLVASVPSVLALLGTGPFGGDLVLPALLAPVAVGLAAAALVRRFGGR